MKRIMFVTNSLTGGGAERAMNLASNELTRRNWPVALVPINGGDSDLIEPITEVFSLDRRWRSGLFETLFSFTRFLFIVRSWKPDVIIVTCDLPELFGALLFSRKKIVLVEEATEPWGTRKLLGLLTRKILKLKRVKTIAASPHLKIWPNKDTPDAVIENALTQFDTLSVSKSLSHGIRLNFVGRLSWEKRPDWFVEICDKGDFSGRLIGSGLMLDQLIEQIEKNFIPIEITGFLKNPWAVFDSKDLLIVPSKFEGDGLAVIEAIGQDIPILLSDIPDFRRFEFDNKHYCDTTESFIHRIRQYSESLEELIVPRKQAKGILKSRSIQSVGYKWERFLDTI